MHDLANSLTKKAPYKGLGADSEEKHEPVSDINTVVADSLKALDPEWPIREADIGCFDIPVTLGRAESGRSEPTMRLTLHTDFALRVLIQVGLSDGKLTTIKDIAQSFGISKQHLMKVVNDLSQMGYLDTVRGRNGGIRLLHEPKDINIGQVVRDTEELDVIGCLEHKGFCPIERVCVLRRTLRNATDAFLAVLDTITLADLIKPRRVLSSLLLDRRASGHADRVHRVALGGNADN